MALELTTRSVAGCTVISCSGRIVLGDESAKLRQAVKEELGTRNQIVLDLNGISHIDSSGLGTLVGLLTSAREVRGGIKLANLNPHLYDILGVARLLTVFDVFNTAEDAAATFNTLAGQVTLGEY